MSAPVADLIQVELAAWPYSFAPSHWHSMTICMSSAPQTDYQSQHVSSTLREKKAKTEQWQKWQVVSMPLRSLRKFLPVGSTPRARNRFKKTKSERAFCREQFIKINISTFLA
jgi:hypothetical protein